jgi:hypothetical protein
MTPVSTAAAAAAITAGTASPQRWCAVSMTGVSTISSR